MAFADQFTADQIEEIFKHGAVGIDLGTTYSAVAAISDAGQVEVLTNSEGSLITPSVVLFDEDSSIIVGEQAKMVGQGMGDRVVECAKRVMGNPDIQYEIDGQVYTPEGISAIILGKLIKDASERLSREIKSAVITVPAWFNDDARQATSRAGQAAGLNVLGILSEPSAAALAYGVAGMTGKTVLVYDLGGGTFDVSVIRISADGQIDELARDGEVELGGKDWDERIMDRFCEAFEAEHGVEIPPDSDAYMTLSVEAEKAKKRLTEANHANIFVQHETGKMRMKITREDFDTWTSDLLGRTESMVSVTLGKSGLTADQIDVVLPVGGSTRMPQARELLEKLFPGKVDDSVEKDQVVAIGACLYMAKKLLTLGQEAPTSLPQEESGTNVGLLAGVTAQQLQSVTMVQVSSRTYGMAVQNDDGSGEYNDHFIRGNDKLPLRAQKIYGTVVDNQEDILIRLLEGDSKVVTECLQVAEQAGPLPLGLPEGSALEMTFDFDEEGTVKITCVPQGGSPIVLQHQGTVMSDEEERAVRNAIGAIE